MIQKVRLLILLATGWCALGRAAEFEPLAEGKGIYDYLAYLVTAETAPADFMRPYGEISLASISNLGASVELKLDRFASSFSMAADDYAVAVTNRYKPYSDVAIGGTNVLFKVAPSNGTVSHGFLKWTQDKYGDGGTCTFIATNVLELAEIRNNGYPRYCLAPMIRKAREFKFETQGGNTFTNRVEVEGAGGCLGVELYASNLVKRTGYTFKGWSTGKTGSVIAKAYYNPGLSASNLANVTTLYAQWQANKYSSAFDANGGTGGVTKTQDYGSGLTAPAVARTGYTLAGWIPAVPATVPASNATYRAQWTANQYKVTLDGQGATYAGTAEATATYGKALPAIDPPLRTGYAFGGYYSGVNGGGDKYYYSSGKSARKWDQASAGRLYARWAANKYAVTLDGNQATSAGTAMVKATYGQAMPGIVVPRRTGYVFAGYYDALTGGTCYYDANGKGVRPWDQAAAATLHARWTAAAYRVEFDGQDATSAGTVAATATYGQTLPMITPPVKTGYLFGGYYEQLGGGGVKCYYSSGRGAVKWNRAEDATLYAKWTAGKYQVALDGRDATDAGTTSVTATYDKALPAIDPPKRTGYAFGGYYSGVNGGGVKYYYSSGRGAKKWDRAQDSTLYAKWAANKYQVAFDGRDATTMGTAKATATYGAAMPAIDLPVKTGYAFAGYYDQPSGGVQYYRANGTSVRAWDRAEDATLHAHWTVGKYRITLDGQGATSGGTAVVEAVYAAALPTIEAPTRTGYAFGGYFDGQDGTGTKYYYSSGKGAKKWDKAEAATLYARWAANKYEVTLDGNQATSAGTTLVRATYGQDMPQLAAPERTGYTFAGYFDATSGGTRYYNADGTSARTWDQASGATLYAHWTANQYTVLFDANGGSASTGSKTVTYDSAYGTLPVPKRTGYTFLGWFTEQGGEVTGDTEVKILADQTLYARWQENGYTLRLISEQKTETEFSLLYSEACVLLTQSQLANIKVGHSLAGWGSSNTGTVGYAPGETVANLSAADNATVRLYAVWTPNTYKVRFDDGLGTVVTNNYVYDSAYTNLPSAVRTGYLFGGWTNETQLAALADSDQCKVTDDDTIFYAKWTPINYNVVFEGNFGDAGGTGAMEMMVLTYDTAVNLAPCALTNNNDLLSFAGWAESAEGEIRFADGAEVENLAADDGSNVVLYAVWRHPNINYALNCYDLKFEVKDAEIDMDAGQVIVGNPRQSGLVTSGFYAVVTNAPGTIEFDWEVLEGSSNKDDFWLIQSPSRWLGTTTAYTPDPFLEVSAATMHFEYNVATNIEVALVWTHGSGTYRYAVKNVKWTPDPVLEANQLAATPKTLTLQNLAAVANRPSGKMLKGVPLTYEYDYVTGTDPNDAKSMFTASIKMVDGVPKLTWEPDLGDERVYKVYKSRNLKDWTYVPDPDAEPVEASMFYKVEVELK